MKTLRIALGLGGLAIIIALLHASHAHAAITGSNGFITSTNPANGTPGSPGPALATEVAGTDAGGILRVLRTDTSGNLQTGRTWTLLNTTDSVNAVQSGSWSLLNITGTVSLPTGASTSALQNTINTSLGTINTTLGSPFQSGGSIGNTAFIANAGTNLNTSALALESGGHLASMDTKLSTINTTLGTPMQNSGGSVTANAGTNLNTSALALDSTVAKDSSLSTLNTSVNTLLKPASTLAAVTTLGTITNALPTGANVIGQVTANAGTNLNTSALALETGGHLASLDTKLPAQGQALAAASVPVVLTAAQLITLTPLTTVTVTQATGTNLHAVVDSSALPTGAATSANQTTANTSLSSIDGKITAVNTGAVVVSSSALPSGAATSANQLNTSGSFVLNTTLTTVITETVPANSVGFILEASSSNAANIRWAIGATATTTSGMRLEPGRDTGFVPVGANISVVAESGTLEYQLTWIKH